MAARQQNRPSAAEVVVNVARLRLALVSGSIDLADEGEARAELDRLERLLDGPTGKSRNRLAQLFALSAAELAALDLAVAIAVEPALGPQIGALQGAPDRPLAGEIALRLLFATGAEPVVRPTRPLVRWGLVQRVSYAPGEPVCWYADPALVDYYFGRITSGDIAVSQVPAVEPLAEWQAPELEKAIKALRKSGRQLRVALRATPGSGRASLAAWLAGRLGSAHVLADAAVVGGTDGPAVWLALQRMALLGGLTLIWRGLPAATAGNPAMSELQFFLLEPGEVLPVRGDTADLHFDLPVLTDQSRASLVGRYLPKLAGKLDELLTRPTPADLAAAVPHDFAEVEPFTTWLRHRYGLQGRSVGRIETPQYDWDDLVLADSVLVQLENFTAEAKLRTRLLAQPERRRLFAGTAALSALLSGPPGLGKSMSAQVIARDLGLDLLVVDASALISKYIGDTAKNYTEAFELARRLNAVLHFEEADGICQTRVKSEQSSESFRNIDLGHLLQLMERFEGPVILSTNMQGMIDPAVMRRMRYVIEFRRPAFEEAQRLWHGLLTAAGASEELVAAVVPGLASAHNLTPAQIKGAVVGAAYRALAAGAELSAQHIEAGVRQEFLKEGRLVSAVNAPGADSLTRITPARSGSNG